MLQNMRAGTPPGFQKKIFTLLLLVALGCIGALPIAPHLLVALGQSATSAAASTRTYTEGQCTKTVMTIIYQPANTSSANSPSLPDAWTQAGRSKQDYIEALACAATFVETFETFDYHQLRTLYTAIPLLSATSQKHFYEGDGSISANIRTDPNWQKKLQQNQVIQVATVSMPTLLDSEYSQGLLYITLDVPYTVVEQIDGQSTTHTYNETVLLNDIAQNEQQNGIGWQVSDWRENT
jgi:hypothetical protein